MSGCRRKAIGLLLGALALLLLSAAGRALGWSGYLLGLLVGTGTGLLIAAVLAWFAPASLGDSATPALKRQYYRDFVPPMAAYVLVMLGWKRLLDLVALPWLRVLVALLPALLVVLVIRAMARYVRDADELQRRIELESVAIAAALVAGGYMTAGFLQSAGLIVVPAAVAMLWVFPLQCMSYGISKIVIARRYA